MKRVKELKKLMILAICGLLCISSIEVTNVQAFSVKRNSRCRASKSRRHKWGNYDCKQPTCKKSGWFLYKCAYCGGTYLETVKASSKYHNLTDKGFNKRVVTPATCTKRGKIAVYCLNNCRTARYYYIPANGHSFTSYDPKTKKGVCTSCKGTFKLTSRQIVEVNRMLNQFTSH